MISKLTSKLRTTNFQTLPLRSEPKAAASAKPRARAKIDCARWAVRMITLVCAGLTVALTAHAVDPNWEVRKNAWTATDERNYASFISALGNSGCNTIATCLKNPANPYRGTDAAGSRFWSDCAKFPYLMRAYFAWKNSLPFSYVSAVEAVEGKGGDLRYSKLGNRPLARHDVINPGKPLDGMAAVNAMMDSVNTAMFRYDPSSDFKNGIGFDFYPVAVNRDALRPGSMIYDPNGHVAIIYKVEDDGRLRFFDAHPDNTVSHGVYGEKFVRSSPGMGAGFKNFRPLALLGATATPSGDYIGGKVVAASNAQLPSYSTEQFFGTNPVAGSWIKGTFAINGTPLDYYDFVRTRMAIGDLKYHPVEEMANGMDALCQDLRDRVSAVDTSVKAGMDKRDHSTNLPSNIYGTDGDWESFSSPSRDARLKTSFRELRTNAEKFVALYNLHSPRIDYQGTNLGSDLRAAYAKSAQACVITYNRTDGSPVQMNFDEVQQRLFKLSFDPYNCIELRWGASSTAELNTCRDNTTKLAWYDAEQFLRNQLDRSYDVPMGFSLPQLQAHVPGSGVAAGPDVDLRDYLKSL